MWKEWGAKQGHLPCFYKFMLVSSLQEEDAVKTPPTIPDHITSFYSASLLKVVRDFLNFI